MRHLLAAGIGAGLVAAVSGCLTTTPTGQQSVGTVAGQVKRSDGSPVQGASVDLIFTTIPVNNSSQILGEGSIQSAADGSFVQVFIAPVAPQNAEVEIIVSPPIASPLQPFDTVRVPVRLGSAFPSVDTTFVPIVLRPRS
jgi:hypothetical protein